MTSVRLSNLFGLDRHEDIADLWPRHWLVGVSGLSFGNDSAADAVPELLEYLQRAIVFRELRPGADRGSVGLTAKAEVLTDRNPLPLVFRTLPDTEFWLRSTDSATGGSGRPARVFITQRDTGVEVVVEDLPVEIRLPANLLQPPTDDDLQLLERPDDEPPTEPPPDVLSTRHHDPDSLEVVMRAGEPASIFVHVRVRMTEEQDFIVEPAVPISIGPCRFFGFHCLAVHDFSLLPTLKLSGQHDDGEMALEWVRHSLPERQGGYGLRTVEPDPSKEPFVWLESQGTQLRRPIAPEVVLQDLVLHGATSIPLHITVGLRQRIVEGDSLEEAYSFDRAPIRIPLDDDGLELQISELVWQSMAGDSPLLAGARLRALLRLPTFDPEQSNHFGMPLAITDEGTLQWGLAIDPGIDLFSSFGVTWTVWSFKQGVSLVRQPPEFSGGELVQILFDLGLVASATDLGAFRLRSLSGDDFEMVWRDVGWNLGQYQLEGIGFPDGVEMVFGASDPAWFRILLYDLGFVSENNGGRYFNVTGGFDLPWLGSNESPEHGFGSGHRVADQLSGNGILLHRARGKVAGDPSAPGFLLDGISLLVRTGPVAAIGYGMYSQRQEGEGQRTECGFGLELTLDGGIQTLRLGGQFFLGELTGPGGFEYSLFSAVLGTIPMGGLNAYDARVLTAHNMMPVLEDGHLPLLRWYLENKPDGVSVPPTREMRRWRAVPGAKALGIGIGIGPAVTNKVALDAYCFGFLGPPEIGGGFLILFGAYFLTREHYAGFGAFEFTGDGRFGMAIGVRFDFRALIPKEASAPGNQEILPKVEISGLLYFANRPGTFALGQLHDPDTWLTANVAIPTAPFGVANGKFSYATCFQVVDRPEGPKGVGTALTARFGKNLRIAGLRLYASFTFLAGTWRSTSQVNGFIFAIEAGFRVHVLYVFRAGISARVELQFLGPNPSYVRFTAMLRIETPWFMPDVRLRLGGTSGDREPETQPLVGAPVVAASALETAYRQSRDVVALTAPRGGRVTESDLYALRELAELPEPGYDAAEIAKIEPIATDSIIVVEFRQAVESRLATLLDTLPGVGDEKVDDLTIRYRLVELSIRRRPRFGPDSSFFTDLLAPQDSRLEPSENGDGDIDFNGWLSLFWDADRQLAGTLDPSRLLINAETPYSYAFEHGAADEALARADTSWPCCDVTLDKYLYFLTFGDLAVGRRVRSAQLLTPSQSTVFWPGSRPVVVELSERPDAHLARLVRSGRADGLVLELSFDRPMAIVDFVFVQPSETRLEDTGVRIRGFTQEPDGAPVEARPTPFVPGRPVRLVSLRSAPGFWRATVTFDRRSDTLPAFLESIRGIGVDDLRIQQERAARCRQMAERIRRVGSGRFAWLPHHEYRIELAVEVSIDDALVGAYEPQTVRQQLRFHTRGLPGLNASPRVGDELEPYVEAIHGGNRQWPTYRAEPVAMVFNEDFEIMAPGERTDVQRSQPEHRQVLEWVLTVEQIDDPAAHRVVSRTADDWLSARLGRIDDGASVTEEGGFADDRFDGGTIAWVERRAATRDPYRQRLHDMASRAGSCGLPDEPLHPSKVLLHRPLDPQRPGDDLWAPNREHRATLRLRGAPYLHRLHFLPDDVPGFRFERTSGSVAPWRLDDDGWLTPPGGFARSTYALVGERDWNRYTARTRVDVRAGEAGIGLSINEDMGVLDGLVASIQQGSGLIVQRHDGGRVTLLAGPAALGDEDSGPVELEVTLFDDRLRARAGEAVLEVERGEHRSGTLGLFLDGTGRFDGLRVHGLDAYAFTFHTSQFVSLEDHLLSHGGHVHALSPGDMGLPSASLAGVYGETVVRLRELERTDDPAGRQDLFDEWTKRLALPWRERPEHTEISRFGTGDEARALLVESPEVLPFGQQLRARLTSGGPPFGPRRHHRLAVLSDGPQLRAILIPIRSDGSRAVTLDSGRYQLRLRLNRERFRSATETHTSNRIESATTTLRW